MQTLVQSFVERLENWPKRYQNYPQALGASGWALERKYWIRVQLRRPFGWEPLGAKQYVAGRYSGPTHISKAPIGK